MNSFLIALKFLSRLPAPATPEITPQRAAGSMVAFPLVGAIFGLILLAADALLRLVWPPLPANALLLLIWVILSGGLHLDGFIDCCDGLWVAKSPAERLGILRDTHVGAYGALGIALLLLVKFAALTGLPADLRGPALVIAPTVSRWAMVYAAQRYPYARQGPGLGLWFKEHLSVIHLVSATGVALALALAGHRWLGPAMLLLAGWTRSRIGGLTGDAYGMIGEVIESLVLLAVTALSPLLAGVAFR
jgi:adenosylcobinamide-GDP ribazoletransferase